MFEQEIEYAVADRTFRGLLAVAAPGGSDAKHAGVLVFHGGSGPSEHERHVARRLATLGYTVLAPDLFGEVFTDRAHGMRVIGELVAEPERLRQRTAAALGWLRTRGVQRAAAIGHCFGGLAALELARSGAALDAAVSFHGGLTTRAPARASEVRARVLVCTGAEDPFCPPDHRTAFEAEMTAAGVDWQHHIYASARHGFTVRDSDPAKHPGCAYHELAANRAWAAMLGLLGEMLGSTDVPPITATDAARSAASSGPRGAA